MLRTSPATLTMAGNRDIQHYHMHNWKRYLLVLCWIVYHAHHALSNMQLQHMLWHMVASKCRGAIGAMRRTIKPYVLQNSSVTRQASLVEVHLLFFQHPLNTERFDVSAADRARVIAIVSVDCHRSRYITGQLQAMGKVSAIMAACLETV